MITMLVNATINLSLAFFVHSNQLEGEGEGGGNERIVGFLGEYPL